MQALVDRFRNATVAGFKDRALLLIVLAFLVSVKQRRGPKMRPYRVQQSQITTPTGSIPNAYNGYLRIPDLQRWSRIILVIQWNLYNADTIGAI